MPVGAAIGNIATGIMGMDAADDAAKAQEKGAKRAIKAQREMFDLTRGDLGPYREVGSSALYSLADLYGLPSKNNPNGGQAFDAAALERFKQSPDYQVAMREGIGAIDASAAARGNLLSGGQIKRLADYGADLGAKGFQGYMNRLYQLAGMGQSSAAQTGAFATQTGQGIAQNELARGEAKAGGIVGGYNALTAGFDKAVDNLSFAAMMGGKMAGLPV